MSDITPNARSVAFESAANGLVADDQNDVNDVFVRDRQLGRTERISVTRTGLPPTGACLSASAAPVAAGSFGASIDDSGRFVAFSSCASNLVQNDDKMAQDVFVRDRQAGSTSLVSQSTAGEPARCPLAGVGCSTIGTTQSISADGRYVAFSRAAPNLVANDTNGISDIFVRDLKSRTTTRVSVASDGAQAKSTLGPEDNPLWFLHTLGSYSPSLSADGRYVAFLSGATNLVDNEPDVTHTDYVDVFVHDRKTHRTEQIDVDRNGHEEAVLTPTDEDHLDFGHVAISPDGRYVAFASRWGFYVPTDTNDAFDVFVHDRVTRRVERVSVDSRGAEADAYSLGGFAFSRTGRLLTFSSAAHLDPRDTGGADCGSNNAPREGLLGCDDDSDVYVHDRVTGTTELLSVDLDSNNVCATIRHCGWTWSGALSGSGRFATFSSARNDLAPSDDSQLGKAKSIFVRDRGEILGTGSVPVGVAGSPLAVDASVAAGLETSGAVIGARAALRTETGALYLRADVDRLPALGSVTREYGFRVNTAGKTYLVRTTGLPSSSGVATFEVVDCGVVCEVLGEVPGGYGTVGDAVVTVVPAGLLGIRSRGDITTITAYDAPMPSVGSPLPLREGLQP